jgi:ankyrin repeat protein
VDILIKVQANLMFEDQEMVEKSPFFQAIRNQKKWAVESMCDNGAEVEELKANGCSPLLYSAINGFDEICMYLCLRVNDVDVEDE